MIQKIKCDRCGLIECREAIDWDNPCPSFVKKDKFIFCSNCDAKFRDIRCNAQLDYELKFSEFLNNKVRV
jgi:hypothetical protein